MTRQYELATFDKSDFALDKDKLLANQVYAHKELFAQPADGAAAAAKPGAAGGGTAAKPDGAGGRPAPRGRRDDREGALHHLRGPCSGRRNRRITRRNVVHALLLLVFTFINVAVIFMLTQAYFLAVCRYSSMPAPSWCCSSS